MTDENGKEVDYKKLASIPSIALYDGYYTYEEVEDKDGNKSVNNALGWFVADKAPSWID